MKTFIIAATISVLGVAPVLAASPLAGQNVEQRSVVVSNAREKVDLGTDSILVTVGATVEAPAATLTPRDRAEAGLRADATVSVATFPGTPDRVVGAR